MWRYCFACLFACIRNPLFTFTKSTFQVDDECHCATSIGILLFIKCSEIPTKTIKKKRKSKCLSFILLHLYFCFIRFFSLKTRRKEEIFYNVSWVDDQLVHFYGFENWMLNLIKCISGHEERGSDTCFWIFVGNWVKNIVSFLNSIQMDDKILANETVSITHIENISSLARGMKNWIYAQMWDSKWKEYSKQIKYSYEKQNKYPNSVFKLNVIDDIDLFLTVVTHHMITMRSFRSMPSIWTMKWPWRKINNYWRKIPQISTWNEPECRWNRWKLKNVQLRKYFSVSKIERNS